MKGIVIQILALLAISANAEEQTSCSFVDRMVKRCKAPEAGADLKTKLGEYVVQVSEYRGGKQSLAIGKEGEFAEYHQVTLNQAGAPMAMALPTELDTRKWGPGGAAVVGLDKLMSKVKKLATKASEGGD